MDHDAANLKVLVAAFLFSFYFLLIIQKQISYKNK